MDGTPTQLLLHAIRGVEEGGSVAMINSDILSRAALFARPADAPGRRLARRDAAVRRARGIARPLQRARGCQRHERVGRARRPDRRGASRLVAGLGAQELPGLARARRSSRTSTARSASRTRRPSSSSTSRPASSCSCLRSQAMRRTKRPKPRLPNGLLDANSRSALGSLAWRYLHPRGVITQRVSFVGNDFVNHGAAAAASGRGPHPAGDLARRRHRAAGARLDARGRRAIRGPGRQPDRPQVRNRERRRRARHGRAQRFGLAHDGQWLGAGRVAR